MIAMRLDLSSLTRCALLHGVMVIPSRGSCLALGSRRTDLIVTSRCRGGWQLATGRISGESILTYCAIMSASNAILWRQRVLGMLIKIS